MENSIKKCVQIKMLGKYFAMQFVYKFFIEVFTIFFKYVLKFMP